MNYTWQLDSLKLKTTSDVNNAVVQTYWTKIGTDDNGNVGKFSGATPFPLDTVDPDNFTAYEDLTSDTILGWIKAVVVGDYRDHVNAHIDKVIADKINPVIEVDAAAFPWTTSTDSEESEE